MVATKTILIPVGISSPKIHQPSFYQKPGILTLMQGGVSGVAQPIVAQPSGPSPVDVAMQAADSAFQQQRAVEQERDQFVSNAETVAKDLPSLQAKIDQARFFPVYQARLVKEYNTKVGAVNQQYEQAKALDVRAQSFYSQGQSQVERLRGMGVQINEPGAPVSLAEQGVSPVSEFTKARMLKSGEAAFAVSPARGDYVLPVETRRQYLPPDVRASYIPPAGMAKPSPFIVAAPAWYGGIAGMQAIGAGVETVKGSAGGQAGMPYVKGFLESPFVTESFEKARGGFEFGGVKVPGFDFAEEKIGAYGEKVGKAVFGIGEELGSRTIGGKTVRQEVRDLLGFNETEFYWGKGYPVTTREQYGSAGRFGAEIGSYLIPPIAVERMVVGAFSLPNPKEFAKYAGIGLLLGGAFKGIGRAGGLVEAKLGSIGAKGAAEYYGVSAKAISEYGVPAVMGAGLAVAAVPALSSIAAGDTAMAKQYTRELSASFGAMGLGAMIGTAGMGRFTSPIKEETEVTLGATYLAEKKEYGLTKSEAREISKLVFYGTKGKMPSVVEEPDWGNIGVAVGRKPAGTLKDYPKVLEAINLTLRKAGARGTYPYGSATGYTLKGMKASEPFGDIDTSMQKMREMNVFYGHKQFMDDVSTSWETVGLAKSELKMKVTTGKMPELRVQFVVGGGKAATFKLLKGIPANEIKATAKKFVPSVRGKFERPEFEELAKMVKKKGGYIGGSGGIRAQLPGFRQPVDIEIHFPKKTKIDLASFVGEAEKVFAKHGKKTVSEIGVGKAKIKDLAGITQADIVLRPKGEKTAMAGGIRVRSLENLVSDKLGALKYGKGLKIAKASTDLGLIAKEFGIKKQVFSRGPIGAKAKLFSIHLKSGLPSDVAEVGSMTEFWPWSHFVMSRGGYKVFKASTQWRRQLVAKRPKDIAHLLEEVKQAKPVLEKTPGSITRFLADERGITKRFGGIRLAAELGISGAYRGIGKAKTILYPVQTKAMKAYSEPSKSAIKSYYSVQKKALASYSKGADYKALKAMSYQAPYQKGGYRPSGYTGYKPPSYKPSDYTQYKPSAYKPGGYAEYKPSAYKPAKYTPYKPSAYKPYKPSGYKPASYPPYKPSKYTPYGYTPYTPSSPPPTRTGFIGLPTSKELRKMAAGFNVFTKRKGKPMKLNIGALTKGSAFGLGSSVARKTLARSFWVTPAIGPGISLPQYERAFSGKQFRLPKGKTRLPRGALVELSKFALDVPSELGEIAGYSRRKRKTKRRWKKR